MRVFTRVFVLAAGGSEAIEAFRESAFILKLFCQGGDLPVEQTAGDGNQNQCGVGGIFGVVLGWGEGV
jgi:hypothetical protein